MAAFSFPDYSKIFKPGLDTSTGKRDVDPYKLALQGKLPDFLPSRPAVDSGISGAPASYDTKNAVPSIEDIVSANIKYQQAMTPIELERMAASTRLQQQLSGEQLKQLYPFLSAAGAEGAARQYAISKGFAAFKEGLPSNIQNIMASKQGQMQAAAVGEAERQRATAAQQEAAKRFAGSFAGQYIQVA